MVHVFWAPEWTLKVLIPPSIKPIVGSKKSGWSQELVKSKMVLTLMCPLKGFQVKLDHFESEFCFDFEGRPKPRDVH